VTSRPAAVVLSSSWRANSTELSFVTRALAGAVSRSAAVTVVAQLQTETSEPDGAFDLVGIGVRPGDRWPEPAGAQWPTPPGTGAVWILDEPSDDAVAILGAFGTMEQAFTIAAAPDGTGLRQLSLTPGDRGASGMVGMHVPVNPLAAAHRHAGLGFTGYVLVLSDRSNTPPVQPPTPAVAWLTARFHDRYIVVVEGGTAAAWKGRALRGVVGVETRTDLWRLLAHASVVVDAAPGSIIGRECIESLLLGTPIVVPEESTAAAHAGSGGGMTYAAMADMLNAVELLSDDGARSSVADRGRAYAEEYYGNAGRFVDRVQRTLSPELT
jgi:hypothetical protein